MLRVLQNPHHSEGLGVKGRDLAAWLQAALCPTPHHLAYVGLTHPQRVQVVSDCLSG